MAWAVSFAIFGVKFVLDAVNAAASYLSGQEQSLDEIVLFAGIGIVELAMSAFTIWCTSSFVQDVRQRVASESKQSHAR